MNTSRGNVPTSAPHDWGHQSSEQAVPEGHVDERHERSRQERPLWKSVPASYEEAL